MSIVDSNGRIVIPSAIRKEAALEPGTVVEISFRDGVIEIVRASIDVEIVRKGRLHVAVPRGARQTLTKADVLTAVESVRRR
ncbi:MAG: AbrB/MazE/SpoVT family DNA-binding domain-containing protein [Thermoanaerobaculia bacterium]